MDRKEKILSEISKILLAFKEEQENYKNLVHKLRKQEISNPLDKELSTQREFYEQQLRETEAFISVNEELVKVLQSEELSDITASRVLDAFQDSKTVADTYTSAIKQVLSTIFDFSESSFDYAKCILDSLDLSESIPSEGGIKGYVVEKITNKATKLVQNHLPLFDEVIEILTALAPSSPAAITKASLITSLELDIRKKLMYEKTEDLKGVTKINLQLKSFLKKINSDESLSLPSKYIKFKVFIESIHEASENLEKSNLTLGDQVDRLMKASLQELFEKSNVSVVQICEYTAYANDGNELDRSKVIKTIFTNNDDKMNAKIFSIAFPGNTTQVVPTYELKKVFPNIKVFYRAQKGVVASTGIDQYNISKDYNSSMTRHKDGAGDFKNGIPSIGSEYANALARERKEDALRREEQKEKIALQAKARALGVDPTKIQESSLKELKEIIAEHELLGKIKGYANHARGYGVDEEIVLRLIAARAEASKFHEEIAKTDKYKKEIQTKKELSDKNVAFGQDLQLNKTYLLGNTFGIYSKEESRYEKEFGGILLDNFQAKIKEMARRIATTKATQLIFRATFRHSYNEGTVKEVCQKLTERLNKHLKELKGKDFHPLSYVLNEVKRTESKDMAGYFVLLKD
ncbi:hypothetical protein [Saprospira grandis]|uniref:Uncharacterized protein n=1 Tax=Saprospira grandis (strain Lewin) TaxID=984262 RepID=H6L116_SAPGL|nr:hypothetical protein [Saprospira grandis]AFC26052.1 hypothetical protein SGRA_3325 [Saprospira grandis str. Lewin]